MIEPIKIIKKRGLKYPFESSIKGKNIAKKNILAKNIREENIQKYSELVDKQEDLGYYDENL